MTQPRVSVVIPTRDRPQLVLRAVHSVLRQTLPSLELLVVQDGEDAETFSALQTVADPRLRVHVAPRGYGPGAVRNAGVAQARAEWIAFLDDDDEMLPERLERQLEAGEALGVANPVVLCRAIVRTPAGDVVLPEVLPTFSEHISDFIFVKKNILGRSGETRCQSRLHAKGVASGGALSQSAASRGLGVGAESTLPAWKRLYDGERAPRYLPPCRGAPVTQQSDRLEIFVRLGGRPSETDDGSRVRLVPDVDGGALSTRPGGLRGDTEASRRSVPMRSPATARLRTLRGDLGLAREQPWSGELTAAHP